MTNVLGILFDGVAYGALLFLVSVGLSVTLGLMNFVNLAHGAFAAFGGYVCVWTMQQLGLPFFAALPLCFLLAALLGYGLERTLYHRLYGSHPLDQVLFSIGLTFVGVATGVFFWGPSQQGVSLPTSLQGQTQIMGLELGRYRLFLIAVVAVITVLLVAFLERTRFGAQVRAAVDNQNVAAGVGIDVQRVFSLTFALGSGLAGLGGGLGIQVLGLDPMFPLKYLAYFLLVVAVGGAGSVGGTLSAALLLGICDVAGKYYVPEIGAFVVYLLMIVLLSLYPTGLAGRRAG